jgi:hypothetical protein
MKISSRGAPPLNALQAAYRRTLSASVLAHAQYLAVRGEKNCSDRFIHERQAAWQALEARKNAIYARLRVAAPRE